MPTNLQIKNELVRITHNDVTIGGNRLDFIIDNKIIIEVKAKPFITHEDYSQTLRYLKAANFKLALLTNFRNRYLRIRRVLN